MKEYTKDFRKNFWSRVDKSKDCWLWTGAKIKGYGSLRYQQKHKYAHRVAWELTKGAIPPNLVVCHHCDNPACVRPSHLFIGTQADNLKDMNAKGRNGAFTKPECVPRGENHCRAKLSQTKADEIRSLYTQGNWSQRKLAQKYGVSQKLIYLIVNLKHWIDKSADPN